MFNLHQTIATKLNWPKDYRPTVREALILTHYQRQVDNGWMDTLSATDRCLGDFAGRNYHSKLDQRAYQ